MDSAKIELISVAADVATVVTALAIVFAILSLLGEKQQRHREFENMYVQRYWSLLDRMSDALREGSKRLTREDRRVAMDYLRLCEDQLDMRAVGLVTHKTWSIWAPAILAVAGSKNYARLLHFAPSDELKMLRAFVAQRADPYHRGIWPLRWAWSKLNGL